MLNYFEYSKEKQLQREDKHKNFITIILCEAAREQQ